MTLSAILESTDAGWKATCNEAVAELRLNGDPFGAHEILMPKRGVPLERGLAEAAILTLIRFLHPHDQTAICDGAIVAPEAGSRAKKRSS
jgi:hypothetical protein